MQLADSQTLSTIQTNWNKVRNEVAEACVAAGRSADEVTIVGVSKYVGPELTRQLFQAGCQVLGENRPQVLWEKFEQVSIDGRKPSWHMIGHFQRNKVRRTLPMISMVQSLDSLRLAQVVNEEAIKLGITIPVLIDVNVTQDETKTGVLASATPELVAQVTELPGLVLRGLMAMSSLHADSCTIRKEFAQVRELRDRIVESHTTVALPELSMGMSADFGEAIAEGATIVRIGSSLWEGIL